MSYRHHTISASQQSGDEIGSVFVEQEFLIKWSSQLGKVKLGTKLVTEKIKSFTNSLITKFSDRIKRLVMFLS